MKRFGFFVLFIPAAMLVAGLFGMIHNQVSYSVSAEYFTKFKFVQFQLLDSHMPERIRAAIVGYRASWWMGVPLGLLCGSAALIQPTPTLMFRALIWSLLVVVILAMVVALAGLAYGWAQTGGHRSGELSRLVPSPDVEEVRRFLCAGYMHNSAYLGGVLSIPVVWLFNLLFRAHNSAERKVL